MTRRRSLSPLTPYRADPVAVARFTSAPYLEEVGGLPLPWPMRRGELLAVLGAGLSALVLVFTVLPPADRLVQFLAVMTVTGIAGGLVYPGRTAVETRRLRLQLALTTYRYDDTERDEQP